MARSLLLAALGSALLHGMLLCAFNHRGPVPPGPPPPSPTLEVIAAPPPAADPELPPGEVAATDLLPSQVRPVLADTPAIKIDSTPGPSLQPPPVPVRADPTFLIAAFRAGGGAGAGGTPALFDLDSLDQRPEPLVRVTPVYPDDLRRDGLTGSVLVSFIVDAAGQVKEPHILESSRHGFEASALAAITQWTFRPGKKGGRAVNTRNVQQPFSFTLSND